MKIYIVHAHYKNDDAFAYIVGAYTELPEAITQAIAQENLSVESGINHWKKCKIYEIETNQPSKYYAPIWG